MIVAIVPSLLVIVVVAGACGGRKVWRNVVNSAWLGSVRFKCRGGIKGKGICRKLVAMRQARLTGSIVPLNLPRAILKSGYVGLAGRNSVDRCRELL